MEKEKKIFYLCDGKDKCWFKKECYANGGDCRHTGNICHAKNFRNERNDENPYYREIGQKERELKIRIDMEGLKEVEQEAKQLSEILQKVKDSAASLKRD